jgi:hypothetical protein
MIQVAAHPGKILAEGEYQIIARAAELCNPFLHALGEVTFMPRGPVIAAILNWNATLLTPLLQPAILEVLARAAEGGSFEIATLDCRVDAAVPLPSRSQSRDAGKSLVQGLHAPRGDRLIERYRSAVMAGDSPGHLVVIHALRAAVFHLPPQLAVAAYLVQEGMGAGLEERDIARFLIEGLSRTLSPVAASAGGHLAGL